MIRILPSVCSAKQLVRLKFLVIMLISLSSIIGSRIARIYIFCVCTIIFCLLSVSLFLTPLAFHMKVLYIEFIGLFSFSDLLIAEDALFGRCSFDGASIRIILYFGYYLYLRASIDGSWND